MKVKRSNNNFVPVPEGEYQAVLCDVVDMGFMPDKYSNGEEVHKMRLVFQLEEKMEDGRPFTASTYPQKASLDSRSNLTKMIKALIGRDLEDSDFSKDEEGDDTIDLYELLKGANAEVTIAHNVKDNGNVFANVVEVTKLSKKIKDRLDVTDDYVRVKDRETEEEESGNEEAEARAKAGF